MHGLVPLVVIENGTLAGIFTDRDNGCWLAAPGVTQYRPGSGRSNSCSGGIPYPSPVSVEMTTVGLV
jgi:hypothetical protein